MSMIVVIQLSYSKYIQIFFSYTQHATRCVDLYGTTVGNICAFISWRKVIKICENF